MNKRTDDYKPLKFYKKHAPKIENGASRFSEDGEHWFAWFKDGEIELISEGYKAKAGRDNGIKSLSKNMKLPARYKFLKTDAGKHYYDVLAGNGQAVATSVWKTSEKSARAYAAYISGNGPKPSGVAKAKPTKAKAAPKKKRAANNEDDYRPLAFFQKHVKGKQEGIYKFKGDDGEYYFTYHENGKIAMISEGYPTTTARDTGAASVEKNRTTESRYKYAKMKNGKHEYRLHARNGKEIARSVWFGSAAAAATGAAYVMGTRKRAAPKPKATRAKPKAKVAAPVVAAAALAAGGAAAAASRPKNRKDDDYLRCAEYHDKPITDVDNNIAAFTHKNGQHYFAVYDKDGDVRIRSEGFPNKAARQSEMNAVIRNIDNPDMYKEVTNGEYTMDVLYDEDEREIGRSCLGKVAAAAVIPPVAAAAPIAAAAAVTPPAAAAAGGGFGWLKWLLPLLLLLGLGLFGLSKCNDGKAALAAQQAQAAKVAADAKAAAEAKAAAAAKKAADMKAAAEAKARAAAAAAKAKATEAEAAAKAAVMPAEKPKAVKAATGALNNCGSSDIAIFNVPTFETPVSVSRLGSYPEFGDSHALSPAQFFDKLEGKYNGLEQDRQYLDYLFKSMGYTGGFKDADASIVSNASLPQGTAGLLGLGVQHHFDYNRLDVTDPRDLEAFQLESKNGQIIYFMKTCGNYMYACK